MEPITPDLATSRAGLLSLLRGRATTAGGPNADATAAPRLASIHNPNAADIARLADCIRRTEALAASGGQATTFEQLFDSMAHTFAQLVKGTPIENQPDTATIVLDLTKYFCGCYSEFIRICQTLDEKILTSSNAELNRYMGEVSEIEVKCHVLAKRLKDLGCDAHPEHQQFLDKALTPFINGLRVNKKAITMQKAELERREDDCSAEKFANVMICHAEMGKEANPTGDAVLTADQRKLLTTLFIKYNGSIFAPRGIRSNADRRETITADYTQLQRELTVMGFKEESLILKSLEKHYNGIMRLLS